MCVIEQKDYANGTKMLLNQINNITEKNSEEVYLYTNTRTTDIVNDFYTSKKQILILKNIYFAYLFDCPKWISLIISKLNQDITWKPSNITMTNIKLEAHKCLYKRSLKRYKNKREYILIQSILNITKDDYLNKNPINLSVPIEFNAQTKSDQTDYGNIRINGEIVHQGNKYGETHDFVIIGIFTENGLAD